MLTKQTLKWMPKERTRRRGRPKRRWRDELDRFMEDNREKWKPLPSSGTVGHKLNINYKITGVKLQRRQNMCKTQDIVKLCNGPG